MSNKDKKILALISGGFLVVLALVLFVTIQARDNMISNTGRVKGMEFGDAVDGSELGGSVCKTWSTWTSKGTAWKQDNESYPRTSAENATVESNKSWAKECTRQTDLMTCTEEGYNAPCYQCTEYSRSCLEYESSTSTTQTATLTCNDVTWNGSSKTLATCTGCDIMQGGSGTYVDTYTVTAQAQDDYLFSNGSNTMSCQATISCPTNTTWNSTSHTCESNTPSCTAGQYLNGTTCAPCPAGSSCNGTSKTACTGNTYSSEGASSCTTCNGTVNSTHTTCTPTQTTPCSEGWWRGENGCEKCPAGSSCNGTSKTACTGNTYSGEGASSCTTCNGTVTQTNGLNTGCKTTTTQTATLTCNNLAWNGSTQTLATCTGCDIMQGGSGTYVDTYTVVAQAQDNYLFADGSNTMSCQSKITCSNNTTWNNMSKRCEETVVTTGCTIPGTYKIGTKADGSADCIPCQNAYVATEENPYCHILVPAGSYLVTATGSEIRSCPAGTYSDSVKNVKYGELSTCTNCPGGKTSKLGATSINDCYVKMDESQCNISASTTATLVSKGSYYNVFVTVSGAGCNGQKMSLSMTKAAKNGNSVSSWNVSDGQSFNFTIIQDADCSEYSTVTAVLSGGKSSNTVTVEGTRSWNIEPIVGIYPESQYGSYPHSRTVAENEGKNEYYTTLINGNYTEKWIRGCGTSSTPTPTTTDSTIYCWKKIGSNGVANSYRYSVTSPGTGWDKIGKLNEVTCGEEEACYQVGNSYTIGAFEGVTGYVYKGKTCPSVPSNPTNPEPSTVLINYCWIKPGINGAQNEYMEGTTSPGSDWEKYGVAGSVTCAPTSACYKKSDGTYVTGDYDGVAGYSKYGTTCPVTACYYNPTSGKYNWYNTPSYDDILITSINDDDDCKAPTANYACYVNSTINDYKWATSSPGTGYVENTTINTPSACAAPESPACYENLTTGSHDWGLYKSNIGYNYISNNKNDCVAACYRNNSTGKLVWGYFTNNSSYKPESSINETNCKDIISNVPKTSASINTIIYVAMAIFAVTGFGFIVYSNYNKKKIGE